MSSTSLPPINSGHRSIVDTNSSEPASTTPQPPPPPPRCPQPPPRPRNTADDDNDVVGNTLRAEYQYRGQTNMSERLEELRAERARRAQVSSERKAFLAAKYDAITNRLKEEAREHYEASNHPDGSVAGRQWEGTYKQAMSRYEGSHVAHQALFRDKYPLQAEIDEERMRLQIQQQKEQLMNAAPSELATTRRTSEVTSIATTRRLQDDESSVSDSVVAPTSMLTSPVSGPAPPPRHRNSIMIMPGLEARRLSAGSSYSDTNPTPRGGDDSSTMSGFTPVPRPPRPGPNGGRQGSASIRRASFTSQQLIAEAQRRTTLVQGGTFEITPDPVECDPVFQIWMAENPEASVLEVAAEKRRRYNEICAVEHALQRRTMLMTKHELDHLEAQENAEVGERQQKARDAELHALEALTAQHEAYAERQAQVWKIGERVESGDLLPSRPTSADQRAAARERDEHERERRRQMEAWEKFKQQESGYQIAIMPTPTSSGGRRRRSSVQIVDMLQSPMSTLSTHTVQPSQSIYHNRSPMSSALVTSTTSRLTTSSSVITAPIAFDPFMFGYHEEIKALRIQCAWRVFVARRTVKYRRTVRQTYLHMLTDIEDQRMVRYDDLQTLANLGQLSVTGPTRPTTTAEGTPLPEVVSIEDLISAARGGCSPEDIDALFMDSSSSGSLASVVAAAARKSDDDFAGNAARELRLLDTIRRCVDRWKDLVRHRRLLAEKRAKALEAITTETAMYAAARIQAVFRGKRDRIIAFHLKHPEIREAQRRAWLDKHATKIQGMCRMLRAKAYITRLRAAATKIQKNVRRFLSIYAVHDARLYWKNKQMAEARECAARILQRFCRRHFTKARCHRLKLLGSAWCLQAAGRGHLRGRLVVAKFAQFRMRAAVRIQTMFRCAQARRDFERRQLYIHEYVSSMQEHFEDSALRIQNLWRLHVARRRLQSARQRRFLEEEQRMQNAAAFVLQTALRVPVARRRKKNRELGVDLLHAVFRGYYTRMSLMSERASVKISRFMRRASCQMRLREARAVQREAYNSTVVLEAAETIQRSWRHHAARRNAKAALQRRVESICAVERDEAQVVLVGFLRIIRAKRERRTRANSVYDLITRGDDEGQPRQEQQHQEGKTPFDSAQRKLRSFWLIIKAKKEKNRRAEEVMCLRDNDSAVGGGAGMSPDDAQRALAGFLKVIRAKKERQERAAARALHDGPAEDAHAILRGFCKIVQAKNEVALRKSSLSQLRDREVGAVETLSGFARVASAKRERAARAKDVSDGRGKEAEALRVLAGFVKIVRAKSERRARCEGVENSLLAVAVAQDHHDEVKETTDTVDDTNPYDDEFVDDEVHDGEEEEHTKNDDIADGEGGDDDEDDDEFADDFVEEVDEQQQPKQQEHQQHHIEEEEDIIVAAVDDDVDGEYSDDDFENEDVQ
eukprot:PhM_4_TR540/c0_g1_i2/m.32526